MTRTRSIAEARNELPRLLHEVEGGDTVAITRRGRTVAFVVSASAYQQLTSSPGTFRERYKAWQESVEPEDCALPEEYFQRLRDRTPGRPVDL